MTRKKITWHTRGNEVTGHGNAYIHFYTDEEEAVIIDGYCTIAELEEIIAKMKEHIKE